MTKRKKRSPEGSQPRTARDPASYSSRTADKFVLRSSPTLLEAVADLGRAQSRSANSEIVQAIQAKIVGRQAQYVTRDCLLAKVGDTKAAFALASIKPFEAQPGTEQKKTVIRLPFGVRSAISNALNQTRATEGGIVTINAWILEAVVWWVNMQRQTNALLAACILEKNKSAFARAA